MGWFRATMDGMGLNPDEVFVSLEDGRKLLDASARLNLNMSGAEFLAAWDDGRILDSDSLPVQQVASLIPFAR